jgi:AGCS family alanine or glycine:cation symporter
MWMTALVGMATKFSEVTLAQKYRNLEKPDTDPHKWEGSVSGGPMYYIEKGLGRRWKPLAIFFAALLGITAFFTGNAVQANTVADTLHTTFGIPAWATGLVTTIVVALVIIGGITRIGRVTSVLAPLMAAIYVFGALLIIIMNIGEVIPTFALIFREAFNPTAGVAGTGVGAFLVTMLWGVKRGLFSNEAGQGSAPIAHAAAKTDEPVSEGVVALVEPFIDTIVIVTMTALVIIITGVWDDKVPTEIRLTGGDLSYMAPAAGNGRYAKADMPARLEVRDGAQDGASSGGTLLAWHEVPVESLYVDPDMQQPFSGTIRPEEGVALSADGSEQTSLYGPAVESAAPMTMMAFTKGLGEFGRYIVVVSVLLFAVSTAIAWSYYGDRCANYLLGTKAVFPYKIAFVLMHYAGAVLPLATVWKFGDIFLGIVIIPNLFALIFLSSQVRDLNRSYFERQPWIENAEAHRRAVRERRSRRG